MNTRILSKSWQCNHCGTVIIKGKRIAIIKGLQVCLLCAKLAK